MIFPSNYNDRCVPQAPTPVLAQNNGFPLSSSFHFQQQKVAQLANNYGSKRATLQSPTVEVRQKLVSNLDHMFLC